MSTLTTLTRDAAFTKLEESGVTWKRVNKGAQWLIKLATGETAIMKIASKGGAMVKTVGTTPETARLIGFNAIGATHMLFCFRSESRALRLFLVPLDHVETTYRKKQREWMDGKNTRKGNTTWVIRAVPDVFAEYEIATDIVSTVKRTGLTVKEAKERLAITFGCNPEQIQISVNH